MIRRLKSFMRDFIRRHICDDDPVDLAERRRLAAMADNDFACGER